MSLPQFDLFQPESLKEACELLARYGANAALLAGGTDILVDIRQPIIPEHLPRCKGCDPRTGMPQKAVENPPAYLIALAGISDLKGITKTKAGEIRIGPMTTITEICRSKLVRANLTALAEGCDHLGSPLVRNRGTIGGNICNARPAADALLPSVALRAQLELVSSKGSRILPISEFVTGPGRTMRKPDEILCKIIFPMWEAKAGSSCLKLANRKALEIAVVNVASVLTLNNRGVISDASIALGSVAPMPMIAHKAMKLLLGKKPSKELFAEAGNIASRECKPITDHRGTKSYRVDMVSVLVRRSLERAGSFL